MDAIGTKWPYLVLSVDESTPANFALGNQNDNVLLDTRSPIHLKFVSQVARNAGNGDFDEKFRRTATIVTAYERLPAALRENPQAEIRLRCFLIHHQPGGLRVGSCTGRGSFIGVQQSNYLDCQTAVNVTQRKTACERLRE